ncbi:hypothetical protein THAOC_02566, partial [Thalassiosira oceanica]
SVLSLEFTRDVHLANSQDTAVAAVTADGERVAPAAKLFSRSDEKTFEDELTTFLYDALKDRIDMYSVSVRGQEYDRPCVALPAGGRDDGVTSLDLNIMFTGQYIKIDELVSFTDDEFEVAVLTAVESNSQTIVNLLKESSEFFRALDGITLIGEDSIVEAPSSAPSDPPTRSNTQELMTRVDPQPTGSYGIAFHVRTPPGGFTIMIDGMSFLVDTDEMVEYEVYSKLGTYLNVLGRTESFELVASGQIKGKGPKKMIEILEDDTTFLTEGETAFLFGKDTYLSPPSSEPSVACTGNETIYYKGLKPIPVPGDRGQRSFYITLTNRYTKKDGSTIPLLFSSPKEEDSEGQAKFELIKENTELQLFEGTGVLDYPWPRDRGVDDDKYSAYRRPRGFVGLHELFRWPCPYVSATKKPTSRPTNQPTPTPSSNSKAPTLMFGGSTDEVVVRSAAPVISVQTTYSPGAEETTMLPVLVQNFSEVDALGGIDVAGEALESTTSSSTDKRTLTLLLLMIATGYLLN